MDAIKMNAQAANRIRGHHRAMAEDLTQRVDAYVLTLEQGEPMAAGRDSLVQHINQVILPHARGEEETIYARAAEPRFGVLALVQDMKKEHGQLEGLTGQLKAATSGVRAMRAAGAIEEVFRSHAGRENDLLLPVLEAAPEVNLTALLEEMHRTTEAPQPSPLSDADVTIDVRLIPHTMRHTTIFALVDRLAIGQALVIEVDHDPLPLRYQLDATHGDQMSWTYLQEGPDAWRVEIRRREAVGV